MLGDINMASRAQKSQSSVRRWLLQSLGKRRAYWGQMKSMMPYGITGLERVKSDKCYDHTILQVKTTTTPINHVYIFYFLITNCTACMSPGHFLIKHHINPEIKLTIWEILGSYNDVYGDPSLLVCDVYIHGVIPYDTYIIIYNMYDYLNGFEYNIYGRC